MTVNSYLKAILKEINVHRNLKSALKKRSCKLLIHLLSHTILTIFSPEVSRKLFMKVHQ